MTSPLEEQFKKHEKLRLETEEKKNALLKGLPTEDQKTIQELLYLKTILSERMEGENFRRIAAIIDLAQLAVTLKKEFADLKDATLQTDDQSKRLLNTAQEINSLEIRLVHLLTLLTKDIDERREQRRKEAEVLDKLGRYLDEWV